MNSRSRSPSTIVISAVVSLTLVPMLCAKLLKPNPAGAAHGDHATGGRFFQWLLRRYASALTVVLNHQILTLLVALGEPSCSPAISTSRSPRDFFRSRTPASSRA